MMCIILGRVTFPRRGVSGCRGSFFSDIPGFSELGRLTVVYYICIRSERYRRNSKNGASAATRHG